MLWFSSVVECHTRIYSLGLTYRLLLQMTGLEASHKSDKTSPFIPRDAACAERGCVDCLSVRPYIYLSIRDVQVP